MTTHFNDVMPGPFSAAEFRRRAKAQAGPFATDELGDHLLNPALRDRIVRPDLRAAAVLVPVVDRGREASVILTQRTANLRSHSGQVAFPGGRIDDGDVTPEAAALRETEEEIGLTAPEIEIVGRMPDYSTGSGYRIAPVFGIVRPGFALTPNPDEVDAVFEVPLSYLMSPENHRRESRFWEGIERHYWVMPHSERFIWGVTAGIIRQIYERLYA